MPTPSPRITGAVSRVRMSPGPRSRIQRAPASCRSVISSTQSTWPNQDGLGHLAGQVDVEADLLGPAADDVDAVGQPRRVEADLDLDGVEDRAEDRAAAHLVLAVGGFGLGDLLAVQLEARQLLGGAGDDDGAPAVADGQHRRQHGPHVLGEFFEQLVDAGRVGVGDRHHRRAVAEDGDAAAAGHQRACRADQLRQRQQLHVLGSAGGERLNGQHALGVPRDRDRRRGGQVHALTGQGAHGGDLGEQDAGHRDGGRRQLLGVGHRLFGGQRAHPLQRLETDRPDDDQLLGHGLEQQFGLPGQRRELGLDTGRGHQLLERLQPRAALSPEGDGIGFAGVETIDKGMSGIGSIRTHRRGRWTPCRARRSSRLSISLGIALASIAYRLSYVGCRVSASMTCAPLRKPSRFGVESRLDLVAFGGPGRLTVRCGHSSRTKSGIRAALIFARYLVTGEFYA